MYESWRFGTACESLQFEELTIAEAVSHRVGLPGTPLPPWRFWSAYTRAGWRGLWDEGIAWAEDTPARWAPGSRALYHHLSWSFIVGGEHVRLHTRVQAAQPEPCFHTDAALCVTQAVRCSAP